MTQLAERMVPAVIAVLATSILMGLLHTEYGIVGVLASTVDSIFYSVLRYRYQTLWASILAHGFIDTIGFVTSFWSARSTDCGDCSKGRGRGCASIDYEGRSPGARRVALTGVVLVVICAVGLGGLLLMWSPGSQAHPGLCRRPAARQRVREDLGRHQRGQAGHGHSRQGCA